MCRREVGLAPVQDANRAPLPRRRRKRCIPSRAMWLRTPRRCRGKSLKLFRLSSIAPVRLGAGKAVQLRVGLGSHKLEETDHLLVMRARRRLL
jgi:hypothetical protein